MTPEQQSLSFLLNKISFWILLIGVIAYLIGLAIISIIIPDTKYIREHPWKFIIELFLFPTMMSLPFILFGIYRKLNFKSIMFIYWSFWIKIMILHILLELSGFYTYLAMT